MKKKTTGFTLILIFTVLALFSSVGPIYTQNRPDRIDFPPEPPERGEPDDCGNGPFFGDYDALKNKLKLTDEQVEKIAAVNLKHCRKVLEHEEKIAPLKVRLKRLLLVDSIDLKAAKD